MTSPLHVDNSTLSSLAKCDTMALLRYGFGWTSEGESAALQCGTACHTALEVYFKTSNRKQALAAFQEAYEAWSQANIPAAPEKHQLWTLKYAYENVRDILKTWMKRHPIEAELYKVFPDLVEIGFSFPLTESVLFYGRYDAIVEEKATGNLYVYDHKAQPLWSKVLTPKGWKAMGDVEVGDALAHPYGGTTYVERIYKQKALPTYCVTFADGGKTYCSDDHLWSVRTQHKDAKFRVMKLRDIIAARKKSPSVKWQVQTAVYGGLSKTAADYNVHPYLLGALIGDGCLSGTTVMFSTAEQPMAQLVKQRIPHECVMVKCKSKNYSWTIKGTEKGYNPLLTELKRLNVFGKSSAAHSIPRSYLFGPQWARLELLRGLMDTDGCISGGCLMYDTVSPQLALDVVALVRSLGGIARWRKRSGTKQQAYRVNFRVPNEIMPFKLPRKKDRREAAVTRQTSSHGFGRYITKIERVADEVSQCIKVGARDGLYITDDFIVTHNTTGQITADWAHTFKTSTQISGYVWAAGQLLGKAVTGAIINGIQISKLPDIKYKLDGDPYKCKEHAVGVDECRLMHTKESLAITQRDPQQIVHWKAGAIRLATRWQKLLKKYPTAEAVSEGAQQQGMFSGACRYCDFRDYCEVGRPADRLAQMLKHAPWKPFNPDEVKEKK